MANTNAPFGLRPVRYRNGNPWTGQARPYYVPASYGTALYIGDPVTLGGSGNASEYLGYPAGALADVVIATAGAANDWLGAVVSVQPVTRSSLIYKPASTEAIVYVSDDPGLVYWLQDDGTGAPAVTNIGQNAVFVAGSGSTITGRSGWMMDFGGSTAPAAAQATYQMMITGMAAIQQDVDDYAIWEITNNRYTLGRAAGVGV